MAENDDLFPIIKRCKKTESEFFNALKNYKYKVNDEYFVSGKLAKLRQEELITSKSVRDKYILEEKLADKRIDDEIALEKYLYTEANSSIDNIIDSEREEKYSNEKSDEDFSALKTNESVPVKSKYYEGFFRRSFKFPNAFISSDLIVDGRHQIVISNYIKEKGFYQCYIRPMFNNATGYVVVKFSRNIFKEKIERKIYFSKKNRNNRTTKNTYNEPKKNV